MRPMLFAASALALGMLATGALASDIVGTPAVDQLSGTPAADHMTGLSGHDDLLGFGGDDVIEGGDDNDEIFGGAGNDLLDGGAGDDYLDGRAGDDTLTGGPGKDVFAFYARDSGKALDNGRDTVTDFDAAEDVILIDGFGPDQVAVRTDGAGTVIEAPGLLGVTLSGVTTIEADDLRFR